MLFVLIPIAWFAVTVLVLALCHMAARGDSDRRLAERRLREDPAPVARDRRATPAWRPAVHGIR